MKKLGVHNGSFHSDDVFCAALMQSIYDDLEVVRTRDESILKQCDIVADVGNGKYDHHSADKKMRDNGIPYCGFGLLWQDFGHAYVKKMFPDLTDENEIEEVVNKVDEKIIQQIDAEDNGVDVMQSDVPVTTLRDIIKSFSPFGGGAEEMEEGYFEAVAFAKPLLYKMTRGYVEHYDNLKIIKNELDSQNPAESHILVLESRAPWKDAILEYDTEGNVLYVVYEDLNGSWIVQAAPIEKNSFANRKDLPKSWGGLRDEALSKETGIEGCTFCHPALFICGNNTKEGALKMAHMAVES